MIQYVPLEKDPRYLKRVPLGTLCDFCDNEAKYRVGDSIDGSRNAFYCPNHSPVDFFPLSPDEAWTDRQGRRWWLWMPWRDEGSCPSPGWYICDMSLEDVERFVNG